MHIPWLVFVICAWDKYPLKAINDNFGHPDGDQVLVEVASRLKNAISEVQEDHNGSLEIEGVIVNQFQSRAKLPKLLVEELENEGQRVLKTRLSPSIKVKESHSAAKPLIHFSPKHKITEEYKQLHQEIN